MKLIPLDAAHDRAPTTTLATRLGHRLAAAWNGYRLRRRLKATVFTLQALDDRTLQDIGLARGEIESAVSGSGRGHRRLPSRDATLRQ